MLSSDERDAMMDYFKDRDPYDPAREPGQKVPDFAPRLNGDGCAPEMGYDDGGIVLDPGMGLPGDPAASDFAGPALSADTSTARGAAGAPPVVPPLPDMAPDAPKSALAAVPAPQSAPRAPVSAPMRSAAPSAASPATSAPPAAASFGRGGDFDALIQALQPSLEQRLGQGAMSGLAGLADAIETGVARAGNPGFQHNLVEASQARRSDLINALRAKYEAGYKGQELAQGEARLAEETRAHNLQASQQTRQLAYEQGKEGREAAQKSAEDRVNAAQKIVEAYEKGSWLPGVAKPSSAEYNAAKNVIKSTGTAAGFRPGPVRVTPGGVKYTVVP